MHTIIDARLALPGQMTGIGRYLTGLAQGFASLDTPDTFEFWLQSDAPGSHPIWHAQGERVQMRRIDLAHMRVAAQWHVPQMLRRAPHDLFHYPHFDLPFAAGGPLVVTLHDLKYLVRPDFFPRLGAARRLAMRLMMLAAVRRARLVMVDSDSSRQDVMRLLHVPSERLRVTPLGVDDRYFTPPTPELTHAARQAYDLNGAYILCVGERRPHKNLIGLLHAFDRLRRDYGCTQITLAIAGATYQDYRAPEELAARLGLDDQVRFIDRPPDQHLPALYHEAAALALLSHYEGFGLPILEAMASGTPVVAANVTSLPEVVGEAGLLVPPDDPGQAAAALAQAITPGSPRDELIGRGRQRAAQFTWQVAAQKTLAVYHEALSQAPGFPD
jgi:alpha-1,3-rhamnosyl/mannosyltransferase